MPGSELEVCLENIDGTVFKLFLIELCGRESTRIMWWMSGGAALTAW